MLAAMNPNRSSRDDRPDRAERAARRGAAGGRYGIARADMDRWALASHRARPSRPACGSARRSTPATGLDLEGRPVRVTDDQGPRPTRRTRDRSTPAG